MDKLILTSVLIASVALPAMAARDPVKIRGLKRSLLFFALFCAVYEAMVAYVYPWLYQPTF